MPAEFSKAWDVDRRRKHPGTERDRVRNKKAHRESKLTERKRGRRVLRALATE